ncbi:MAG: molecular chaperone DnaJ [Chloroflexaceae bacterium]|nr:molecular chaperone DnaJ [Chloroflexaceae bacterium]
MSEQNPYEQLGVSEDASFEEVQGAKMRLREQYRDDPKVVERVEAAYDAIIMERLRLRQEGKIKVPERIRFPERSLEVPPVPTSLSLSSSPSWLQRLVDTPSRGDILWPAGVVFGSGGIGGFSQSGSPSVLSLLIALGFIANLYFLNRKEKRFLRALLLTLAGLLVGAAIASGLIALLPQGAVSLGDEQWMALMTFCLFWLISSFLR